jgi:hypothetical protein
MDSIELGKSTHSSMRNHENEYVSEHLGSGLSDGAHVSVDLKLASSYLPGIFSICKVVVLLASMNIMQKLGIHMEQAIVVCASCIYLDRCLSIRYIMDTGGCSLCVLVSIGVNASRVSLRGEPGIASITCSVIWAVVSVLILHDMHRPVMRYVQIPGVVHVVTSGFCVAYAFMALDLENDAIAYTRAVAFSVLCVLWVYTLSLGELRETFNGSFSGCVDRFSMVLVADIYVTSIYVFVAIVCIVWQHRSNLLQQHQTPPSAGVVVTSDLVWGSSVPKNSVYAVSDNGSTDDVDVHTAFRLAQENARKGNHSR